MYRTDILLKAYNSFTECWDVDQAIEVTPKVYPFKGPSKNIRDAICALNCKKDKDWRFSESRKTAQSDDKTNYMITRFLDILERDYREKRFNKIDINEDGRRDNYKDAFMMLYPIISSQKGGPSITLDIIQLNENIYGECKTCSIKGTCKEAFALVTEYISGILNEFEYVIPINKQ
jgi:hypothetical protein